MIEFIIEKEFKTCSKCNESYPATEEFFYKQKTTNKTYGTHYKLSYQCRNCMREKALEHHHENKEKRNKRRKELYWLDTEKNKAASKKSKYNNLERFKTKQKEYRENNKDKLKEYANTYKNKQFKISTKQWESCKRYFDYCCAYCGISEQDAQNTYDKGLHKEHAINKGSNDLSNCIPSCTGCNTSKWIHDYFDWYSKDNPIFSEERYKLIDKWLHVEYKLYI
jgi:hypothetical protein